MYTTIRFKTKFIFFILSLCTGWLVGAQPQPAYRATLYGIRAGAPEVQTEAIQQLIDRVSAAGGGTVCFGAGEYVTGNIELKAGVFLHLEKGAILLGSTDPADYREQVKPGDPVSPNGKDNSAMALITANRVTNIGVTGGGTIDGRGLQLALHIDSLHHRGVAVDPRYSYNRNRPNETARPKLFRISHAEGVTIKNVTLRNSACWGVTLELSRNVVVDSVTIVNRAYWNNDGIDITDCTNVRITRCDIDAADDGICLKSYYPGYRNDSVYIAGCRVCSSASAVKFGTASHGGFRNVVIDDIEVYDTFRSAIAIETVDGGDLENVRVTRIRARNTGNPIFIRLGHRAGKRPGILRNVYIGQMRVEVPFGRPDAAYDLRGPALPFFHNPFPSPIAGIPGHPIENVTIEDVEIVYPGRATRGMAYLPLWRLQAVPEEIEKYPEFSMFGELPAWGFYVRHAKNIVFRNVRLRLAGSDYRPAFVLDDVQGAKFEAVELPVTRGQVVVKDCSEIETEHPGSVTEAPE